MPQERNPLAVKVGARIRAGREALGWTQKEAAKKASVTPKAWESYENGRALPPLDTLLRIADIVGRSVLHLMGQSLEPQLSEEEDEMLRDYRDTQDPTLRLMDRECLRANLVRDVRTRLGAAKRRDRDGERQST